MRSMMGQASEFAGVSPKLMACSACTVGVETHFIHMYAQFGSGAWVASIQVSAHPDAPSCGISSATAAWLPFNVLVWYGQAAPATTVLLWNRLISSLAAFQ